jgi:hypothetical protein
MSSFVNFGTGQAALSGAVSLLFKQRKVRIGENVTEDFLPLDAIELDASLEELHTQESDIVTHPIERGSDIVDHVRRKPRKLRIKGIVTNHPPILGAGLRVSLTRAEEFYTLLEGLKDLAIPLKVLTTLSPYENFLIKSFSVPRNAAKGNVVEATINLEEVFIVDTQIIVATPVDVSNGSVADAGKIGPPAAASAATAVQSQSALSSGAGLVGKFVGLF